MKFNTFQLALSNLKCNLLFFDFKLVTRKRNKKSLTLDLETRSEIFYF